jgi:hypothetical protein
LERCNWIRSLQATRSGSFMWMSFVEDLGCPKAEHRLLRRSLVCIQRNVFWASFGIQKVKFFSKIYFF